MICMGTVVTLNAQSQTELPQTVQATVSAGGNADHFYVAIGQPFFLQIHPVDSPYELSMGVAQAQWTRDTVYDVITYNTPYTENGFNLPAQTETHKDSVYLVNGGIYNYDLWRTLYLIVCDSAVADAVNAQTLYEIVGVSGHCWTKQNLRTPADDAMSYSSTLHPTVPEEYGLLYTWQTALNGTTADADGYVRGLCPENWHMPNAVEVADLSTNPTPDLRSTTGWVNGGINTNSTGFTAYPAGIYIATTQRFEGLGTQTDWWTLSGTTVNGTTTGAVANTYSPIQASYYCDTLQPVTRNANDALSVRCVKVNVWPE